MRTLARIALWCAAAAVAALSLLLLWLVFPGKPDGGRSLRFEGFVQLPEDGRTGLLSVLDYLTASDGRLFVTNSSTGTVYKIGLHTVSLPSSSEISLFPLEPAAHGVAVDPVAHLAYVTRSQANTVDIFNPETMRLIKRLRVADDPDGIFYTSTGRTIYVANGDAKSATLIDSASQRVTATIPLGAKPEYGAFDVRTQLFYQNLQDANALAGVDVVRRAVARRWPLQPCQGPTGMAIDETREEIFIGCGNAILVVFSLATHRVVATVPLGGSADSVAYDAMFQRIYVTGRAGKLSVIERNSVGGFAAVDTISLHYGAHTLAIDPASHRLYVGYASLLFAPRLAVFSPKPKPNQK